MKRFLTALLAAAMLLLLTGCEFSSGVKLMCVESSTSTGWRMSYAKFTGTERETIRIDAPGTEVVVMVETDAGTLDMKVTTAGSEDGLIYAAEDMQTGMYTFTVPAGRYKVTVTADDHSGSFSLDWGK